MRELRPRAAAVFAPNGARLDPVDLEVLRRLQEDAHVQNQALARMLGLSASGCLKRVRRLEEGGAIKGYVALAEETTFASWSLLWVNVKLRRRARWQSVDRRNAGRTRLGFNVDHSLAARFCSHPRTFAGKRKCATEEMSVVCLALSENTRKNSVICYRETIEWETRGNARKWSETT